MQLVDGLLDASFGDGEWKLGKRRKKEREEKGDEHAEFELDDWDVSDRFFVLSNKRNEYLRKRSENEKEKKKNKEQRILEGKESEEDYDVLWLLSHPWKEAEKENEGNVEFEEVEVDAYIQDEEEEEDRFDGDDYYDEDDLIEDDYYDEYID
jgi:hypothetical protein